MAVPSGPWLAGPSGRAVTNGASRWKMAAIEVTQTGGPDHEFGTTSPDPTIPSIRSSPGWSPYAFADRPVSEDDLRSLFEAARWAPSSYNEQPWSYLVATKASPGEFERLLSCLVEGNQAWAKAAPCWPWAARA